MTVTAAVLLLVVLGTGLWAVQTGRLEEPVAALVTWARGSGIRGKLAFAGVMPVWVALMLPGFIITMAAGVAWGPWVGAAVVHVPQVLGMTLAFLSGRYLFRDAVERRVKGDPRFEALDRAVEDRGFVLVLLLRLSPVVPYNVLNYALGLTSVRLGPFMLASLIGAIPSTLLYAYLGASIGRVATSADKGQSGAIVWWVGLGATVVLTVVISRIASRAVRNAMNVPEPAPVDAPED